MISTLQTLSGAKMLLLKALLVVQSLELCFAFGLGPPHGACVSLFPSGHGYDSQKTTSPYTISVSKTTYTEGETIEVFLDTASLYDEIKFFEGVMLQARRADCDDKIHEEAVGTFTLVENEDFLGLLNCQGGLNNTIAHKAHDHIYNRTFYWTAPTPAVGHIYFRATVARRQRTFWTTVKSDIIKENGKGGSGAYCPMQEERLYTKTECGTQAAGGLFFSPIVLFIAIVSQNWLKQ